MKFQRKNNLTFFWSFGKNVFSLRFSCYNFFVCTPGAAFVRSLVIHSPRHSFIHLCIRKKSCDSFTYAFIHSPMHLFIHLCIRKKSCDSFTYAFIHSPMHLFIHLCIRKKSCDSFTYTFIHSFIHAFIYHSFARAQSSWHFINIVDNHLNTSGCQRWLYLRLTSAEVVNHVSFIWWKTMTTTNNKLEHLNLKHSLALNISRVRFYN